MRNSDISKTEDVVIRLKMQGLTHKEIACRVFRSPMTIQTHFQHIYQKCRVQNEIELYNWYLENKLHIDIKKMIQISVLLAILLPSILMNEFSAVRNIRSARSTRVTRSARNRRNECETDFNLQ